MPTTKEPVHGRTASLPDSHDVVAEASPAPLRIRNQHILVTIILTFGIPAHHASVATVAGGTMLGKSAISCPTNWLNKYYLVLKALVPAWEASTAL